jgi:hypothetical protein
MIAEATAAGGTRRGEGKRSGKKAQSVPLAIIIIIIIIIIIRQHRVSRRNRARAR